ncbi:Long-chain-fatty-acid--CoA ligase FadD15 [Usitatibacter rugosus]|uniref:Long-chain-fatty-acid--CoA ligase FadD15 n=1 Tax=Usitatibacter rugosus TaxID=2732067 RepID=A0A6M4GVN1_9PROT|nr:long-chain fatty acid--CoA ligase [Usitatibacter rugosus]QJR09707.1 Long-chain-fatty-acid--CoA ligase FadD15 [Usitatibacter rugosus]
MSVRMPHPVPVEPADTIADVFARRVALTPGAFAYREYDPSIQTWRGHKWSEIARDAGRVRAALLAEGLQAGDRVAIMLRNCCDWVAFDQGAHAEGIVVVPLYVEDRPENFAYILDNAGVQVILVEGEEHVKRLREVATSTPTLKRIVTVKDVSGDDPRVRSLAQWLPAEPSTAPPVRVGGNTLATIVYTSGTTGKPKGVMLSHQNMLQNVKSALGAYQVYTSDVFLSFLPLSHMFERTVGYYLTMTAGALVTFARSTQQLTEDFKTARPTVIVSVPRIFERLHAGVHASLSDASPMKKRLFELTHRTGWAIFEWRQGRGAFYPSFLLWPLLKSLVASKLLDRMGGRLRLCISGGAALNPSISHTFIGLGLPICQGYGLTEAAPIISGNRLEKNDPTSIGSPLPGVEIAFDEAGALLAKGPNIMLGYWKNEEATAKVLNASGWLNTGDRARIENGFLYITGRIKEIIVLGNGEKVPPVDMELAVQLDPLFEQVMIVGEGKPYLGALVVLSKEAAAKGPVDEKALTARVGALVKGFPGYAQIRRIAIVPERWTVENGMLTPTLKLKRGPIGEKHQDLIDQIYKGH